MCHVKIATGVIAVVIVGAVVWSVLSPHTMPHQPTSAAMTKSTLGINGVTISVDVAASGAAREQGLSDRLLLEPDSGMLFVFDTDGRYGFWMKHMRFPLDLIWADARGTIVTIEHDVSPATYPRVFYPARPARYVVEVNAGFAAAHNVAEGQTIVIQ